MIFLETFNVDIKILIYICFSSSSSAEESLLGGELSLSCVCVINFN